MAGNEEPMLRVASYNIRAGLGSDLRRDPARTLATIAALNAGIVLLQEADFRLGDRPSALPRDMIHDMTGLSPVPLKGHPDSLGWHGIALLVSDDIAVAETEAIDLPGLEPRGAILAHLETGIGAIHLAGVHLGLLRSSRRRQLDRLRHALSERTPDNALIMGDFNEWSVRRGLGRIARDYRIVTPGRTFPSRRPLLALDRIAHGRGLEVAALPLPHLPRGPGASDHLPILARVTRAGPA